MFDKYMQIRCKFNVFISFRNHFRPRFYQQAMLFIIIMIIDKNRQAFFKAAGGIAVRSPFARYSLGVRFLTVKSEHRANP